MTIPTLQINSSRRSNSANWPFEIIRTRKSFLSLFFFQISNTLEEMPPLDSFMFGEHRNRHPFFLWLADVIVLFLEPSLILNKCCIRGTKEGTHKSHYITIGQFAEYTFQSVVPGINLICLVSSLKL